MAEDAVRFNAWLRRQRSRNDSVGEFARAALGDPHTRGFGTLIGYWVTWAQSEELEEGAYEAIAEFEREEA